MRSVAKFTPALAAAVLLFTSSLAFAQETVDVGVLKNRDISVVQNVLYPKAGRLEIGGHVGWMAFDPLVTAPNFQLSIDKHFSNHLGFSTLIGGGYGFKSLKYAQLEGPAYGVAPYAYGYLASALFGVEWAPIYGKMTFGGAKVVHSDVYGALRGGATLERSIIPGGGITAAPTVSLAVGTRFWVKENLTVRLELRDDLMVEYRKLTSNWNFKQNAGVTLGVTWFAPRSSR